MKIKTEKRKVVGYLHTHFGIFPMLGNQMLFEQRSNSHIAYNIVDAEGFKTDIVFSGEFVVIPDVFQPDVDVKIVVPDNEAVPFDDGTKPDEVVELKSGDEVFDGTTHIVGYDYQI